MSINEMERKARELRELQALKDAIKAAMGDAEEVHAGDHMEGRNHRQNRHRRAGSAWHEKSPLYHRRPKQGTESRNHHREAGKYSVPPPANKCKGTFTAERKLK